MSTDRGSRPHADTSRSEPGSKAITPPENAQSHSARGDSKNAFDFVPTLDAIRTAEKLAIGAVDLMRVYAHETDPKSTTLIESARTRLTLALDQLAAAAATPIVEFSRDELREIEKLFSAATGRFPNAFYTAAGKIQELQLGLER